MDRPLHLLVLRTDTGPLVVLLTSPDEFEALQLASNDGPLDLQTASEVVLSRADQADHFTSGRRERAVSAGQLIRYMGPMLIVEERSGELCPIDPTRFNALTNFRAASSTTSRLPEIDIPVSSADWNSLFESYKAGDPVASTLVADIIGLAVREQNNESQPGLLQAAAEPSRDAVRNASGLHRHPLIIGLPSEEIPLLLPALSGFSPLSEVDSAISRLGAMSIAAGLDQIPADVITFVADILAAAETQRPGAITWSLSHTPGWAILGKNLEQAGIDLIRGVSPKLKPAVAYLDGVHREMSD